MLHLNFADVVWERTGSEVHQVTENKGTLWSPSKIVWRVFWVFFKCEVLIYAAALHFLSCSHWRVHYWKASCPIYLSENVLETPSCFTKQVATKPNATSFYRRGLIMQRQMEVLKMLQVTVNSLTRAAFLSGGLANWTSVSFHNLNSSPLEGALMKWCCRLCDS